ncbi:putative protease YdcP [Clostridiales bacterium]|nr:putative protease YdcP [Clostridiales bacterium]
MCDIIKPELLAPAGDLEKLKTAVLYGADAVYIGGEAYGLRAKAKNFDIKTMEEGISFAHDHGAKVYVTANIFAHNNDFDGMEEYFRKIAQIGADAVLVSDPGVLMTLKEAAPDMEIHISTQANNTNYRTAKFWYTMGAKRIVAARELSIKEIKEMRKKIPPNMEIETFVHGAMCISYSGRCLLSSYLSGRDANKGACSHPCRWKYYLMEETRPGEYMPVEENDRGTYIFNSKDLCMLGHIPDLFDAGVSSFKIEGRMKTAYYVGAIVKAYRQAIDDYFNAPEYYESRVDYYISEAAKVSHRDFTTGFFYGRPGHDDQVYTSNTYIRDYDFVGMVVEDLDKNTGCATVMQRNKFEVGDRIEVLPIEGDSAEMIVEQMWDENGISVVSAPHPEQILKLKTKLPLKKYDMLRKASKK